MLVFFPSRGEEQSCAETPEDRRHLHGRRKQRLERDSQITSLTRADEPELLSSPQLGREDFVVNAELCH